jgi:hypothetical protein
LDKDHKLPERHRDLLVDLRDRGVETTLATGRIYAAAAPFIRSLDIKIPVILYNGALLSTPDGDPLRVRRLSLEAAHAALEISRDFPIHPQLYLNSTDSCFFVNELTEPLDAFSQKDGIPAEVVGDLGAYLTKASVTPMKLLFIGPRKQLVCFRERLQIVHPATTCVLSEQTYLEILPSGVSKGTALHELCQSLEIPLERVIAFGDNLNDLEMIQTAGVGVAVAHAPTALREAARIITDDLTGTLESLLGRCPREEITS